MTGLEQQGNGAGGICIFDEPTNWDSLREYLGGLGVVEKARIFAAGADGWNNACLNYGGSNYEAMCIGYFRAADELSARVIRECRGQDTLIFPIAFLYRHYVELRLKQAIAFGQRLVGDEILVPNDHRLINLWHIAKRLLERIEPEASKTGLKEPESLIKEIDKIDPEAVAFRYSRDKKGRNPLKSLTHINVRVMRDEMTKLTDFFEGVSSMLDDYMQHVLDSES